MIESSPFARFLASLRGQALSCKASRATSSTGCARSYHSANIIHGQRCPSLRSSPVSTCWIAPRSQASRPHAFLGTSSPTITRHGTPTVLQRCWTGGIVQTRGYIKSTENEAQFGELTEEQYTKSQDRFTNRSAKTIHQIFGPGMNRNQGNHLLDTIQKQRVSGTLDMPITGPNVTKATTAAALAWLRQNYPLDEDAAIMARLEREEAVIKDWKPQQNADPKNVWGESELDRVRAHNVAEAKKREEAEKAEAERLEKESGGQSGPLAVNRVRSFKELTRPRETRAWVQEYRKRAALSTEDTPPTPHPARILTFTGLFAAAVVVLCVAIAAEYEPPARSARMFPEIPPAAATVGAIMGINFLFYLCWKLPPLWRMMNMNMLMVSATPNPVSLLGNIFSHQGFGHLAVNMLGVWFIGTALHDEVGRGKFLAIYVASGVLGSYASLLRFVLMKNYTWTTLGASGALSGLMGAYCGLNPHALVSLPFLPTDWQQLFCIRADWVFTFLFITEFVNIARRSFSVDHVAHMGGMITGAVAAEAIRRHSRNKEKRFINQAPTIGKAK